MSMKTLGYLYTSFHESLEGHSRLPILQQFQLATAQQVQWVQDQTSSTLIQILTDKTSGSPRNNKSSE